MVYTRKLLVKSPPTQINNFIYLNEDHLQLYIFQTERCVFSHEVFA